MDFTDDQWKNKTEHEIWDMHIPEDLFENLAKRTSARLVSKGFEPSADDEIIK